MLHMLLCIPPQPLPALQGHQPQATANGSGAGHEQQPGHLLQQVVGRWAAGPAGDEFG